MGVKYPAHQHHSPSSESTVAFCFVKHCPKTRVPYCFWLATYSSRQWFQLNIIWTLYSLHAFFMSSLALRCITPDNQTVHNVSIHNIAILALKYKAVNTQWPYWHIMYAPTCCYYASCFLCSGFVSPENWSNWFPPIFNGKVWNFFRKS